MRFRKKIILMFDEIFLKKNEDYEVGELVGAYDDGQLYRGILCFMIVGLQESVTFMVKAISEIEMSSDVLKNEIFGFHSKSGIFLKEIENKTLLNEDCDWEYCLIFNTENKDCHDMIPIIEANVIGLKLEGLTLDKDSHEVSVYISGYIAKKLTPRVADCCACMVFGENDNQEYLKILTRGGLTTSSNALSDYVSSCFALLDEVIELSNKMYVLPARAAAGCFLQQALIPIHTRKNCLLL